MRPTVVLCSAPWLIACASSLATSETTPAGAPAPSAESSGAGSEPQGHVVAPAEAPTDTRAVVHATGLSAEQLLEASGIPSYLADQDLRVASIDRDAMERWFTHPPRGVFLFTERGLGVVDGPSVHGQCQRVPAEDDLSLVIARRGHERTVLELGQYDVHLTTQLFERRQWTSVSVRTLPLGVSAWDDAHIAYAEGAAIYEVACVDTARAVLCSPDAEPWAGPRGYCLDRALVVRPWLPALVPHVGPIVPGYPDATPRLPAGACEVECAPSACDAALRSARLPSRPLYREADPVLAVFRSASACRAFASSRGTSGAATSEPW